MKKHTSIIMSFALALAIAYSLTSCGNKTKDMAAGIADQAKAAVSMDDGKHNEAYIRERIDSMYSHIKIHESGFEEPVERLLLNGDEARHFERLVDLGEAHADILAYLLRFDHRAINLLEEMENTGAGI